MQKHATGLRSNADPLVCAVLFGPLQAVSYLLNHGILSAALCTFWSCRAPVLVMIPVCAGIRVLGQAGSIVVSSWALQENIFALIVNNLYSLLVGHALLPLLAITV